MNVITRLLGSQKTVLAVLGSLANAVLAATGVDPTEGVALIANSLFGVLLGAQVLLDLRWGSQSDGSGVFTLEDDGEARPAGFSE